MIQKNHKPDEIKQHINRTLKMESVILTKEQYDEIIHCIDSLKDQLKEISSPTCKKFIENSEFISMMKVSKKIAWRWRNEGKISYSQIGDKVYYLLSDIELLLNRYYNKSASRPKR